MSDYDHDPALYTPYEAYLEKMRHEGKEAEEAEARAAEYDGDDGDDYNFVVTYEGDPGHDHRTDWGATTTAADTGPDFPSIVPLPNEPGTFVRTSSGYKRLDKAEPEEHLDGYVPYVARMDDGTQVLVATYWDGGRLTKVTVAEKKPGAYLAVWGPPVDAKRER